MPEFEEAYDVTGSAVSEPYPSHLGRGSVHQAHLVEVSVLRDQCEPMLFTIFPDRKCHQHAKDRPRERAGIRGIDA